MQPTTTSLLTKKVIVIGLAVLLLTSALGIGLALLTQGGGATPSSNLTLTIWGFDDQAYYQASIDQFKKEHPGIDVLYRKQRQAQYVERILGRKQQKQDGSVPDVLLFHNTWTPELKDVLTKSPQSLVAFDNFKAAYYPVMTQTLTLDDTIVGLPATFDGLALFSNTSMLAAQGVAPPKEWEEFGQVAVRLTRKNGQAIETAGAAIGSAETIEYFSDLIGLMLVQLGTTVDLVGKDQEANAAVVYYTHFATGPDRVWDDSLGPSQEAFAQGRVAMIFATAQDIPRIRSLNKNLAFGVSPVPQLRPEEPAGWARFWAWGVSRYAVNQTLAWQLALALSSQNGLVRANNARFAQTGAKLPYPLLALANRQQNDPLLAPLLSQAKYAGSLPLAAQTQDGGLNDKLIALFKPAISDMTKGGDPNRALGGIHGQIVEILQQYNVPVH